MRCYMCKREFDPTIFVRDRSKSSGFKSLCKACDCARGKRYYADNRERVLARIKARSAALRREDREASG